MLVYSIRLVHLRQVHPLSNPLSYLFNFKPVHRHHTAAMPKTNMNT